MRIRAATVDDYPVFERLFPELQTGEDTPGIPVWSEEIAPQTLLVERDGEVAGYIYVQILDGLGYVRHVAVGPGHRGSGVGRALMQEVAGRLHAAGIRWNSGARLLVARQAEAIVGAAVFRPEFPGAYPFRARTPAVARAILDAMRPHADLSKGYVQLVFEDAAQLEAAFDAAGATRHLEIVHFRGDVPG